MRDRVGRLVETGRSLRTGSWPTGSRRAWAPTACHRTGDRGRRPVAVMANDPTVKAGSWGPKTVEKIIRIQEGPSRRQMPVVYLVDSAGARITEQVGCSLAAAAPDASSTSSAS